MVNKLRKKIVLKIVIMGDGAVGKTSIVRRYLEGEFKHEYLMTVGVDLYTKKEKINIRGKEIDVTWQIWDLSGQQYWREVVSSFYKGAHGAVLVFDITNDLSYQNMLDWALEFSRLGGGRPIVVVGNKIDLRDKVPDSLNIDDGKRKAYELSKLLGIKTTYIETSALENINISEVFNKVKEMIVSEALNKIMKPNSVGNGN